LALINSREGRPLLVGGGVGEGAGEGLQRPANMQRWRRGSHLVHRHGMAGGEAAGSLEPQCLSECRDLRQEDNEAARCQTRPNHYQRSRGRERIRSLQGSVKPRWTLQHLRQSRASVRHRAWRERVSRDRCPSTLCALLTFPLPPRRGTSRMCTQGTRGSTSRKTSEKLFRAGRKALCCTETFRLRTVRVSTMEQKRMGTSFDVSVKLRRRGSRLPASIMQRFSFQNPKLVGKKPKP
jgi:hypothetical protein